MPSQTHIQDELKALNSELPFDAPLPYQVPVGYFEGLAAGLLAKAKAVQNEAQQELETLSPLLAGISKKMPYQTPPAYFESPAISFVDDEASPLLRAIGRQLPYEVPTGYFADLPQTLLQKVSKPAAKVVPLFARPWMRVATAAAIAGAVFIGGYQLAKQPTVDTVAATNRDDKPVAVPAPVVQQDLKQASTQALEAFIADVEAVPPVTARRPAEQAKEKASVEAMLKDVPLNEVEQFLSGLPTGDDDLFLTD